MVGEHVEVFRAGQAPKLSSPEKMRRTRFDKLGYAHEEASEWSTKGSNRGVPAMKAPGDLGQTQLEPIEFDWDFIHFNGPGVLW